MNKLYSLIIFAVALTFTSCEDWTEVENTVPENSSIVVKDDAYYADLRAWKDEMFLEHKHKFLYSWYGWNIPENETVSNEKLLDCLPDSVGLVCIWSDYTGQEFMYSDRYKRDLELVQKKGTRVVFTFKPQSIGTGCTDSNISQELLDKIHSLAERHGYLEYFEQGLDDFGNEQGLRSWPQASVFKCHDTNEVFFDSLCIYYGDALLERMDSLGADGIDFDYEPFIEPVTNNFWTDTAKWNDLVARMAEHIGPCAKTEEGKKKLFIIDGELKWLRRELLHKLSYFFPQTYSASANNSVNTYTYSSYILNSYAYDKCKLTKSELIARTAPAQMNTGNFTDINGKVFTDKWMGLATYVGTNENGEYVHSAGCGRFMGFGSYYDEAYPYETYVWATELCHWLNQVKDNYDALDYDEIQHVKDEYLQEFIDNDWWPITYESNTSNEDSTDSE